MHSNAVNNSRLTVPVTGVYNVTFAVTWLANATGIRDIALKRNGTIVIADDFNNTPSADGAQEVTTQVRLRAGEFVVGEVLQSSGGPLPISKLEAHSPELSMTWLAPG